MDEWKIIKQVIVTHWPDSLSVMHSGLYSARIHVMAEVIFFTFSFFGLKYGKK